MCPFEGIFFVFFVPWSGVGVVLIYISTHVGRKIGNKNCRGEKKIFLIHNGPAQRRGRLFLITALVPRISHSLLLKHFILKCAGQEYRVQSVISLFFFLFDFSSTFRAIHTHTRIYFKQCSNNVQCVWRNYYYFNYFSSGRVGLWKSRPKFGRERELRRTWVFFFFSNSILHVVRSFWLYYLFSILKTRYHLFSRVFNSASLRFFFFRHPL